MGIGGAVIFSLVVMAAEEVVLAVRWLWRVFVEGAEMHGDFGCGIPCSYDRYSDDTLRDGED
jgi:hypothetical protein